MAKTIAPAAPKKSCPPCPRCDATRGRTLLSEDRAETTGDSRVHLSAPTARRYRCHGCGRSYTEESDR